MPYSIKKPPDKIKGLPKHAQEIWIKAFNNALKQYDGDEERANKVAYAAVKDKYINTSPITEITKNAFERYFAKPDLISVTKIAKTLKTNKENSIGMLLPRIMLLNTIPRPNTRIMSKNCAFMRLFTITLGYLLLM